MRALRDDPLARLHVRRQIDEAQYHGGRAFQRDFEAAERGPKAIDFTKEAVDGGSMPEPITEAQRKAARRLAQVYRNLGQDGSAIAHDVLVHGLTMAAIAMRRGLSGRKYDEYFGMRFRECLDSWRSSTGSPMRRRTGDGLWLRRCDELRRCPLWDVGGVHVGRGLLRDNVARAGMITLGVDCCSKLRVLLSLSQVICLKRSLAFKTRYISGPWGGHMPRADNLAAPEKSAGRPFPGLNAS
jgi:hypothetical protein